MPGFDGTGPMGQGPMTGGGRGRCNPQGAALRPGGAGMGFGRGGGRGHRRMFYATGQPGSMRFGGVSGAAQAAPETDQELSALKAQTRTMRDQLDAMAARIAELEE